MIKQLLISIVSFLSLSCGVNSTTQHSETASRFGPWPLAFSGDGVVSLDNKCKKSDFYDLGMSFLGKTATDPASANIKQLAGKCIETRFFRPTINVEKQYDSKFNISRKANHIYAANVKHTNGFYIAEIPADKIQKVSYWIEQFGSIDLVSHGMMLLHFSSPVKLYSQKEGSSQTVTVRKLVLSVHAVGDDNNYDPVNKGLAKSYAMARGIFTLDQKLSDVILGQGNSLKEFDINMASNDAEKFLKKYISGSQNRLYSKHYDTLKANCGTELLYIMHQTMGTAKPKTPNIISFLRNMVRTGFSFRNSSSIPDITPGYAFKAMYDRSLISTETPTLTPVQETAHGKAAIGRLR